MMTGHFWFGLVIGLFAGTTLGVFIMSALALAKKADNDDYPRIDDHFIDLKEDSHDQQYYRQRYAAENSYESRQ